MPAWPEITRLVVGCQARPELPLSMYLPRRRKVSKALRCVSSFIALGSRFT